MFFKEDLSSTKEVSMKLVFNSAMIFLASASPVSCPAILIISALYFAVVDFYVALFAARSTYSWARFFTF